MRKNEKEQKRTMQGKSIMMGISTLALLISNSMVAFASSGNYGQNGANWMLDQIFWVALVAFIVGAVVMAAKKNTIGVVTTIIVGAVVCYFIKNPTTLSDIGEKIMEKKIYAFQNIVLPFPIAPYEVLEFLAVVGAMLVMGRIFPILNNIPVVLRYGMLPYVTVKYLMKVKLDGKNPVKYFCGYLRFLFTRKECIERFRICRDHGVTVRINWNCGRRLE